MSEEPVAEPILPEPAAPEISEMPIVPEMPATPEMSVEEAPVEPAEEIPAEVAEEAPIETPEAVKDETDIEQVREAALRDLAPILGNMHINPSQKFRIYRDIYETTKDAKVFEPAYEVAKDITDENERGEALLYLVESIDKM